MLTHSAARSIAEALWGKGGTTSTRTNRKGAFYFNCSGHGGFIIDSRCLSHDEHGVLLKFHQPEKATEFYDTVRKTSQFMTPYRTRRLSYYADRTIRLPFTFWVFEEDCDWCLPVQFCGITPGDPDQANEIFHRWFDPNNPEVQERARQDKARAEGNPNLIISATHADYGQTLVTTADGKQHFINNYNPKDPWL